MLQMDSQQRSEKAVLKYRSTGTSAEMGRRLEQAFHQLHRATRDKCLTLPESKIHGERASDIQFIFCQIGTR